MAQTKTIRMLASELEKGDVITRWERGLGSFDPVLTVERPKPNSLANYPTGTVIRAADSNAFNGTSDVLAEKGGIRVGGGDGSWKILSSGQHVNNDRLLEVLHESGATGFYVLYRPDTTHGHLNQVGI